MKVTEDAGVWCEKYRPLTMKDVILDHEWKKPLNDIIEAGRIPHMILSGSPGVGKTTIARALCNTLNYDYLFINASANADIETLRTKITQYASTVVLGDKKGKAVILDEADNVTSQAFFPALRPAIEQFSKNCTFILTCNNKERIASQNQGAILSRLQEYDFILSDKKKFAQKIMERCQQILKKEKVEYTEDNLGFLISKFFPDMRKILNVLQQNKTSLTSDKLKFRINGPDIEPLIKAMRDGDFPALRAWIASDLENLDNIYVRIYDRLKDFVEPDSIFPAILVVDEFMRTQWQCVSKEIHVVAFLIDFARTVKLKK